MSTYFMLFWALLALTALAAFRWGGWPERAGAAMYLAAALATILVRPALATRYQWVEGAVVSIDILLLVGLIILALRADRWWPICATALQTISILSHVAAMVNPNLWRLGYALMEEASSYPMVILLACGVWRHQARVRKAATRS